MNNEMPNFLKFKVTKSALILYVVFSFINKIDVVKEHQLTTIKRAYPFN